MDSRLEQIISEIEEYIDNCKFQPLSKTMIAVNKEEMEELLSELRSKTPEEIKRYQKMIANRDAILSDAQAKADEIISAAQIQTTELISEHQIMQQAYAQANEVVAIATNQAQEILDKATEDANSIRTAAVDYMDQMLANFEGVVGECINAYTSRYDSLVAGLQETYNTVVSNRNELNGTNVETAAPVAAAPSDASAFTAPTAQAAARQEAPAVEPITEDDEIDLI